MLLIQTPGTELPAFFESIADVGALEPGEFEAFAAWADENFGTVFFDPSQYPPGQTVLDDSDNG